ncbi:hypothetical protein Y032_0011g1418 [Ancylostoma ceylanicum]|uniref:Uncharacterized protein n=1 Tax=Ancylostoma ceylanicum TaxID=53326 RepID=A0A016VEW6_9BILA|nr:hypothetical protein Y032_0011g1418 [Ancylostoma ceylanicum]
MRSVGIGDEYGISARGVVPLLLELSAGVGTLRVSGFARGIPVLVSASVNDDCVGEDLSDDACVLLV